MVLAYVLAHTYKCRINSQETSTLSHHLHLGGGVLFGMLCKPACSFYSFSCTWIDGKFMKRCLVWGVPLWQGHSVELRRTFAFLVKKLQIFYFIYFYLSNRNKDYNIVIHKRKQAAIKCWTYYKLWSLHFLCVSLMFSTKVICSDGVFQMGIPHSNSYT